MNINALAADQYLKFSLTLAGTAIRLRVKAVAAQILKSSYLLRQ
jgi:hypothetical protein